MIWQYVKKGQITHNIYGYLQRYAHTPPKFYIYLYSNKLGYPVFFNNIFKIGYIVCNLSFFILDNKTTM